MSKAWEQAIKKAQKEDLALGAVMSQLSVAATVGRTVALSGPNKFTIQRTMEKRGQIERILSAIAGVPVTIEVGINLSPKKYLKGEDLTLVQFAEQELGAEVVKVKR